MPWKSIKRDCKQKSTGKGGSHVVVKKKKDGSTEQESCHTSDEKAKAALRARYASKNEVKMKESTSVRNVGNHTMYVQMMHAAFTANKAKRPNISKDMKSWKSNNSAGYKSLTDEDKKKVDEMIENKMSERKVVVTSKQLREFVLREMEDYLNSKLSKL